MKRVVSIVGIALAALLAIAGTADAAPITRSTDGAKASCSLSTQARGYLKFKYATIRCSISDTKADGKGVYVHWWQDGYAKIRLSNTAGTNTTVNVTDRRSNPDGSFQKLNWKVCRDVPKLPDNCSSTFTATLS